MSIEPPPLVCLVVYIPRQSIYNVHYPSGTSDSCLQAEDTDGSDYRGTMSTTVTGNICQMWTSQTPNNHEATLDKYVITL